jgi:hypothetical protein
MSNSFLNTAAGFDKIGTHRYNTPITGCRITEQRPLNKHTLTIQIAGKEGGERKQGRLPMVYRSASHHPEKEEHVDEKEIYSDFDSINTTGILFHPMPHP